MQVGCKRLKSALPRRLRAAVTRVRAPGDSSCCDFRHRPIQPLRGSLQVRLTIVPTGVYGQTS